MANFWDLPRPVRDTIYRLHLVQDNHLDEDIHTTLTQKDPRTTEKYSWKFVPPICIVSQKAEAEAAPIYYGENHFAFGRTKDGDGSSIFMFTLRTWPRHIRLIRKVTYQWPKPHTFYGSESGMAGEAFTEISRFKGLQELYIRVDEKAMIRRTLVSRRSVQRSPPRSLHYQDGFALLRHPGMSGLLKISDVPRVQFVKRFNKKGEKEGGPIPGGFLMTEILPKLKAHRTKKAPRRRKGSFDFLALPPELRNRVYGLLLKSDGPVHPSTRPPSSVPKGRTHARDGLEHGSALNLLAVNRQIYDEAYGIFYAANELEFYYPVQLQAFMLGLSHQRLSLIKNVTIHYHNVNSGGVNLADMSFRMLRQLSGLRRLHVLFVQDDLKKRLLLTHWISSARYGLKKANPLTLPGMKELFGLRGIDDIFVQDVEFDEALKDIKKDKRYPDDFAEQSREKVYLQFERVMEHLNAALADAQKGKVNAEMLEDDKWHLRDEFPVAPELEHTADKDAIETMDDDSNADDHQGAVEETAQEELAGDSAIGAIARKPARPVTRAMKRAAEEAERARAQADADQDSGAMAEASTETLERIQPSENKTSAAADYPTIEADDDDNEIVVKHVVRPSKQQAETAEGSSQSTLIEAEEEKDDESDVEDSYAMREISVEL